MTEDELGKRVTASLALMITGSIVVGVAMFVSDWMTWATGVVVIRFGMWLAED